MKESSIKIDTKNESEIQRFYNYELYPRVSIITTNRGFSNIDNGFQGGTHWTCCKIKDRKSF